MKSFKFIKVCLLALGVCSFAFAGVKAAPPHGKRSSSGGLATVSSRGNAPNWLLKKYNETWSCLPIYIKDEILKCQESLSSNPKKGHSRKGRANKILEDSLDLLIDLIHMGSNSYEKDNIRRVIGFYPHPNGNKNLMYINNAQLRNFLGCSKSGLNFRIQDLGYSMHKIQHDEHPFLKGMSFDEFRSWKGRIREKNTLPAKENLSSSAEPALPDIGETSSSIPSPAQSPAGSFNESTYDNDDNNLNFDLALDQPLGETRTPFETIDNWVDSWDDIYNPPPLDKWADIFFNN